MIKKYLEKDNRIIIFFTVNSYNLSELSTHTMLELQWDPNNHTCDVIFVKKKSVFNMLL